MAHRKPGESLTLSYIPSSTVEPVITAKESDSPHRAITLMELHDFSQLPVVRGSSKQPKGVATWETIGRTLALHSGATLKDCIDTAPAVFGINDDLIGAIRAINEVGYSLAVKSNRELSGIVTSADLGATLAQIVQPFLLLERLEERLSLIIECLQGFGLARQVHFHTRAPEKNRSVEATVNDLTLGEKAALATREETWQHVTTVFDRNALVSSLDGATKLRNRLMHFRPLEDDDTHALSVLAGLVATPTRICEAMPEE